MYVLQAPGGHQMLWNEHSVIDGDGGRFSNW